MTTRNDNGYVIFAGICPDEKCKMKLYFPIFENTVICHHCGQRHNKESLENVEEIRDIETVFRNVLRGMLMSALPKRGTEAVKVLGLSNYHCKLLSPLLTKYGMDKETGKAKPLSEMNQGDIFDCGLFGDRAFLIDPEHISIPGFGRDVSGSTTYLQSTLDLIKTFNNDEERLVPIHADGDGHCLVHAISRSLVGRELFWHPLRCSLKKHLEENLPKYKEVFKEFVDESDWKAIVDECDPEFSPPMGELLGLRNIHVFGLANVLRRPIILLDTVEYMDKMGDYAALFLPSMVQPDFCKGKDGHLNKPLCIAWSSEGHNHYIPLVGIKKGPLPILPKHLLPKVWGVPQEQIEQYIEFDENGCCTIGGDRNLGDPYILRLVSSMEELFHNLHEIHPDLVADVHHYLYASTGTVGVKPSEVLKAAQEAVKQSRLYRCLTCNAINEQVLLPEWFKRTGLLYNMALLSHGVLRANQTYAFTTRGILCRYDAKKDELVPDLELSSLDKCCCCEGSSPRKVRSDGTVIYKNRDKTKTPSKSSLCSCGFKHYWNGKEYDNLPQQLAVCLEWSNKVIKDVVVWFQNESDPTLNSNVYQVASEVVQKHFPGEFGSERLVQRVVDQLLEQTKSPEIRPAGDSIRPSPSKVSKDDCSPSKIILGGTGVLHREELGVSSAEQDILHRIETRAYRQQKRQASAQTKTPEKAVSLDSAKVLHDEELGVSSTESVLYHRIETRGYHQQKRQAATKTRSLDSPVSGDSSKVEQSRTNSQSVNRLFAQRPSESSKFIKVVTSDGQQGKLDLGEGITFETLQKWISDNFQIAPSNQKIKHGFPPQELNASSFERGAFLPLSPGQRIVVEVSQSHNCLHQPDPGMCTIERTDWPKVRENWEKNDQDAMETSVLTIKLAATLAGLSSWEYAQGFPSFFEANGIFYNLMKRDVGLAEDKHGTLPMFPNKKFAYNSHYDRLELCVEPFGHYTIETGVEEKVLKCATQRNYRSCFSSGRNSYLSSNQKKVSDRVPFQGTGYTLKDSETKSAPVNSTDDEFKVPLRPSPSVLVRKAPGFSVLSNDNMPENPDLDRLHGLAQEFVNDSELKEEESHSTNMKISNEQGPQPSVNLISNEARHVESPTFQVSQTAVNATTCPDENYPVNHMPEIGEGQLASENVHIAEEKNSDLPESKTSPDHPMDDWTGNMMDTAFGKGDEDSYVPSTLKQQNVEMPDESQAMDVDNVVLT